MVGARGGPVGEVTLSEAHVLYVLGPMSGYPGNNAAEFKRTAAALRALGHEVVCPVELDEDDGVDLSRDPSEGEYVRLLARDVEKIGGMVARDGLDGAVALDGWEESRGAALEVMALKTLGRPIYRLVGDTLEPATPDRHPGSERFHRILRDLGHLHDRKQRDYGRADDPFANVRAATEWGVPEWVGAMIRATDKVRRLQTFAQRGTLANEGVEDAFMDLAVYAVIGLVLFQEGNAPA